MKPPPKQAIWSATDGAVLAEAAFVLPLLLALVFGVEEYGRLFLSQTILQRATYAAARCWAVYDPNATPTTKCPDAGSTQTYASSQLWGILQNATFTATLNNPSSACVNPPGVNPPGGNQPGVTVTANYTFNFAVNLPALLNGAGGSALLLRAKATYCQQN